MSRKHIDIVGSSTLYPFSTVVAERFGRRTDFRTPKVEPTGSGGGIKLFCGGVGEKYPDIVNSSRRITELELRECARNGVSEVAEIKPGYDGIVLANSTEGPSLALSPWQLWLALAKQVPANDGEERLVANPHRRWSDIAAELPPTKIEVFGPPPTSGTRDAFVELALEAGCSKVPWIANWKKPEPDRFKAVCHTIREDGAFVEAGENDNLVVQKLFANPNAFGIFGFNFLDQNAGRVQGAAIDGIEPSFETIAAAKYPIARPLYMYVKKAHVGMVPGIVEFLTEFASSDASGAEGYLADKGMIPVPEQERPQLERSVEELPSLTL